jgi:hydrogenase maturation protease
LLIEADDMKTLIIGLGNPILGNDGAGWAVAEMVEEKLAVLLPDVRVDRLALAGISLMEQMIGFERVILIDSLNTGKYSQGQVVSFTLDCLEDLTYGHSASAHDLSLKKALALGRNMAINLPDDRDVSVVAIEARRVYDFGIGLSPEIESAVPLAAYMVYQTLGVEQPFTALYNVPVTDCG